MLLTVSTVTLVDWPPPLVGGASTQGSGLPLVNFAKSPFVIRSPQQTEEGAAVVVVVVVVVVAVAVTIVC